MKHDIFTAIVLIFLTVLLSFLGMVLPDWLGFANVIYWFLPAITGILAFYVLLK